MNIGSRNLEIASGHTNLSRYKHQYFTFNILKQYFFYLITEEIQNFNFSYLDEYHLNLSVRRPLNVSIVICSF